MSQNLSNEKDACNAKGAGVKTIGPSFGFELLAGICMLAAAGLLSVGAGVCLGGDAPGAGPLPGSLALGPALHLNISPGDRCPVCGMRPIKYPKFACAVECSDGATFYFCSAGCLLRAWIYPQIFLSRPSERLKRGVVLEYFSGRPTDAAAVTWVAGSDVIGPMGPAIVPLAGERHLEAFRRRHGGGHTFQLAELTDALWRIITAKSSRP